MSVGTIHKLKSGGFLVETSEPFPVWFSDMADARRHLLERDLMTAEVRSSMLMPRSPALGASA